MTKQLLLILPIIFLFSCQSTIQPDNKEIQLLQKENELLQKENELLKNSKPTSKLITNEIGDSDRELKPIVEQSIDWVGTWSFEEDMVGYTLTIEDKYKGMNICTYDATGIQTFYILACSGLDKGKSFELYYGGTKDGGFHQEESINREKPILTLKLVNGKVLTYWNQLIGGKDGKIAFKKTSG